MKNSLEIRRQLLHALYGPALVILYHWHILTLPILTGMVIGGGAMVLLLKEDRLLPLRKILVFFERDEDLARFPGKGMFFFTLGALLTLALFPAPIAYAGILILSAGDAVTNLVGRHWGRIKTRLNPRKHIEGTAVGILVSAPIAYAFVPNPVAAVAAACIAMVLEIPNLRIGGFELDDNVLVPLAASLTLSLFK